MPELKPFRGLYNLEKAITASAEKDPLDQLTGQEAVKAQQIMNLFAPVANVGKYPIVMVVSVIWGFIGFFLIFGGLSFFGFVVEDFLPEFLVGALPCIGMPLLCGSEILIIFGGAYLMDRMISGRVGTPVVQASAEEVRRGDPLDVSLLISAKGDVNIREVMISFVLRETATYTSGTDKVTVTHEHLVGEFKRPGRTLSAGHMFEERVRFDVPHNAIHTFYATNNKLNWLILVNVDIPSWPDFREAYEIIVLPEAETGDRY